MDKYDEIIDNSSSGRLLSSQKSRCPECAERSYLKMIVAELLYKNQTLRFDLLEANAQLAKAKGTL